MSPGPERGWRADVVGRFITPLDARVPGCPQRLLSVGKGRPRMMEGHAARSRVRGWEVEGKLFGPGVVAIMGAIVGGGLEAFGVQVPVLSSVGRQVLLGVVGLALVGVSFLIRFRADGPDDRLPAEAAATPEPATSIQSRRLDAAMPKEVRAGRPTEVWVQILRPKSAGFRADLPKYTQSGEEIDKDDVRAGAVSAPFPKDTSSGKVLPLDIALEVAATDFAVAQPVRHVQLSPTSDSALVIFTIVPEEVHERSRVLVTATAQGKGDVITVGSVSLTTRILDEPASADDSWVLASVALPSLAEAGSEATAEEPAEVPVVTPTSDDRVVVAPDTKAILCGTCGQTNSLDAKFCKNCGKYLEWGGETIDTSQGDSPVAVERPKPVATVPRPAPKMQLPRSQPGPVSDGSQAESGRPSRRLAAIAVGAVILGAAALVILVAVVATRGS
jgi:hypothetical protein